MCTGASVLHLKIGIVKPGQLHAVSVKQHSQMMQPALPQLIRGDTVIPLSITPLECCSALPPACCPAGPPQLMMSFTADGQLDPALLQERDKMFNLDTGMIRESRADWAANKPTPHPAADHPWVTGKAWTTAMQVGV